jgi:hypothetical protein
MFLKEGAYPVQYPDRHMSLMVQGTPPPYPMVMVVAARPTMPLASRTSSEILWDPIAREAIDTEDAVLNTPAWIEGTLRNRSTRTSLKGGRLASEYAQVDEQ